jgi:hypothetical protein
MVALRATNSFSLIVSLSLALVRPRREEAVRDNKAPQLVDWEKSGVNVRGRNWGERMNMTCGSIFSWCAK